MAGDEKPESGETVEVPAGANVVMVGGGAGGQAGVVGHGVAVRLRPDDVEAEPARELMVPGTGELVLLDDVPAVARALAAVKDLERKLRDARAVLEEALVDETIRVGTKTLHVEGRAAPVVVKTGSDVVWDVERLRSELTEAGLPADRLAALIVETVEYKVNGTVARQLASSPAYADIVARCRTDVPRRPYVKVD